MKNKATAKPVIALDVDGVIRDIASFIVADYNRKTGNKINANDISGWDFPELVGYDWKTFLFHNPMAEVQRMADEYPKAYDQVARYADKADIYIVSNQANYIQQSATLDWLEDYGYLKLTKGVTFLKDKTLFRADYLIDDFPGNIQAAWDKYRNPSGCMPVLVDRPWNRSHSTPSSMVMRVADVGEALSWCCD